MSRVILFAALLAASGAHAQTVILKCVDKQGRVTYTNDVCGPGQSLKDVKAYAPVREDPRARDEVRRIDDQMQVRYRSNERQPVFNPGPASTETPRDRQKRACAVARERAAAARGKGYNNSTLVALDKAAMDACFGL